MKVPDGYTRIQMMIRHTPALFRPNRSVHGCNPTKHIKLLSHTRASSCNGHKNHRQKNHSYLAPPLEMAGLLFNTSCHTDRKVTFAWPLPFEKTLHAFQDILLQRCCYRQKTSFFGESFPFVAHILLSIFG